MVSLCDFVCIYLMTNDISIMSCAYCLLYVFFGEISIQLLYPFSNWVIHILLMSSKSYLYI